MLTYIDTGVIYPEIRKNPSSVFSFLLVAGYLKYDKTDSLENGSFMCQVAIPNKEISFVYEKEVLSRFEELLTPAFAVSIQKALYMADAQLLAKES